MSQKFYDILVIKQNSIGEDTFAEVENVMWTLDWEMLISLDILQV